MRDDAVGEHDQEAAVPLCRHDLLCFAASLAALPAFARAAGAQDYPSRPLTLAVPYAAGGSADTLPRVIAQRMRATLASPSSSRT